MRIRPHEREDGLTMTVRARWYIGVVIVQHALLAAACVLAPGAFRSSSFAQIKAVLPLPAWGIVFAGVAVVGTWAFLSRREPVARMALILSAAATAVWAGGYASAYFAKELSGPTGPIVWAGLVARDLIVCRQPLRSPFEPLVRAITGDRRVCDVGRAAGDRRRPALPPQKAVAAPESR